MSYITDFLSNIKLSLTQIGLLIGSSIIGGLLLALKLQGTELHRAQLKLLEQSFHNAMDLQDNKVDAARQAFQAAKDAYVEAGGEL